MRGGRHGAGDGDAHVRRFCGEGSQHHVEATQPTFFVELGELWSRSVGWAGAEGGQSWVEQFPIFHSNPAAVGDATSVYARKSRD